MTAKEELLKFIFDNEFITKPRLKNYFEILVNRVIDEAQQQVKNLNIPAVSNCTHENTSFEHIRYNMCDDCGEVVEIDV